MELVSLKRVGMQTMGAYEPFLINSKVETEVMIQLAGKHQRGPASRRKLGQRQGTALEGINSDNDLDIEFVKSRTVRQ